MEKAFKRHAFGRLVVAVGVLAALFTASIALSQAAYAAPPQTMNFQGRLADSSGSVMANGSYNMRFSVFSEESGGTTLWTEVRQADARVVVYNGLFSVQLGEVEPLPVSIFDNPNLYFEVTMATPATATCSTVGCASWETPMSPRSKLATSAYAFNSARLNGHSASDFAAASGSGSYLQNQNASPQSASFNISGGGRVGGAFTAAGTSTFNGDMTVNSAATFSASSTTAFRIQSAGGAHALLTADTTNNRIQVGSATPDSNAIILVLDSSSATSDPTGVNGAMYYSGSMNRMRCYENGAWKNCDSNTKGTPTVQTEMYYAKPGDFVLADSSSTTFTVVLPSPSPGATVSVKKINAGNSVLVHGDGALIDSDPTHNLSTQWHSQDYFSDGTQWYKV